MRDHILYMFLIDCIKGHPFWHTDKYFPRELPSRNDGFFNLACVQKFASNGFASLDKQILIPIICCKRACMHSDKQILILFVSYERAFIASNGFASLEKQIWILFISCERAFMHFDK